MPKFSYNEERQRILFRASRELWKVACEVLDDVQEEAELTGATAAWAASVARTTALLAAELEDKGHEQAIAGTRADHLLYESRQSYSKAVDEFEKRIRAVGGNAEHEAWQRTVLAAARI